MSALRTLLLGLSLASAAMAAQAGDLLAGHRWQDRVVLLLASHGDPALAEQRRRLEAAASAMAERDVVVLVPAGAEAARLRQRFGLDDRFAVLLLGKDGGVKLQAREPVAADELTALIDAMPMRRQEMGRSRARSSDVG